VIELRHPVGELIRLQTALIVAGAGVPGASLAAIIKRLGDGKFFNGSISAPADPFQTAVYLNSMSQLDAVNLPGVYKFDFPQARDPLGLQDYAVRMLCVSPMFTEDLILRTGPQIATLAPTLRNVFGTLFDGSGQCLINQVVRANVIPVSTPSAGVGIGEFLAAVSTDATGFFQLPLIRGVRVRLEIPAIGYDKRVLVPAASSADFTTL
jgi:hypothetical protein